MFIIRYKLLSGSSIDLFWFCRKWRCWLSARFYFYSLCLVVLALSRVTVQSCSFSRLSWLSLHMTNNITLQGIKSPPWAMYKQGVAYLTLFLLQFSFYIIFFFRNQLISRTVRHNLFLFEEWFFFHTQSESEKKCWGLPISCFDWLNGTCWAF